MKRLRTLPTSRLLVLIFALLVLSAGGAALAVAASGDSGPTPPPKPLAQALHDAVAAQHPDGITARITFTNKLFPSGALLGRAGSSLMSGASGRMWVTGDGRGRIELQSDAGDAQIVWSPTEVTVYDASSNTVYQAALPAQKDSAAPDQGALPTVAQISDFLTKAGSDVSVSDAQPVDVAGRAAYSVTVGPKHDGGLLGSVELAWDAENGVPLRAAIYAQGASSPVVSLAVSDISYGAVSSSDVDVSPPAGAKVVELDRARPRAPRPTRARRSPVSAPFRRRPGSRSRRRTRWSGCRSRTCGSSAGTPSSWSTARGSARSRCSSGRRTARRRRAARSRPFRLSRSTASRPTNSRRSSAR